MITPTNLKPGDVVGVYSPSASVTQSPDKMRLYEAGLAAIRKRGYAVKEGEFARGAFYHMSATAEQRASDVHALFRDPQVRALIPSIGGHTASQMLEYLDLPTIRDNPKILVGFSDSSGLAAYISDRVGLATYHSQADVTFGLSRFGSHDSPLADRGRYTEQSFWSALEGKRKDTQYSQWLPLRSGKARGPLIGGNLTALECLVGTPYEPTWDGRILFWETGDPPHRIGQVLSHLRNAGMFRRISGMVVGKVHHLSETFYAREEVMPVHKLIALLIGGSSFPVIVEADIGHDVENITLVNGLEASLEVTATSAKMTQD